MAQEIGAERQQDFLRRFGFLDRMAIELAEAQRARPLLPEPWSELSAMTISYGHGLTTSPLALAAGYAALVNGGRQVTPTLLRRDAPPDAPQVISARSSAQMREILHDVVYEGTASFARIPGYPVGGKTGSADKPGPNGGYKEDAVLATFASVFPSHDPKIRSGRDTGRKPWTPPAQSRAAPQVGPPCPSLPKSPAAWPPCWALRPVALKQAEAKLQADTGAQ